MKDPYAEGLATHSGPESCGAAREVGGEALTGVCAGRVLSRESVRSGCRRCTCTEGNTDGIDMVSASGPARSETPCSAETPRAGTGRSRVLSSLMARRDAEGSLRTGTIR